MVVLGGTGVIVAHAERGSADSLRPLWGPCMKRHTSSSQLNFRRPSVQRLRWTLAEQSTINQMAFSRLERLVEWQRDPPAKEEFMAMGPSRDWQDGGRCLASRRQRDDAPLHGGKDVRWGVSLSRRRRGRVVSRRRRRRKGVFSGRRAEKTQERTRCDSSWCFRVRRVAERSSGRWRRISKERR